MHVQIFLSIAGNDHEVTFRSHDIFKICYWSAILCNIHTKVYEIVCYKLTLRWLKRYCVTISLRCQCLCGEGFSFLRNTIHKYSLAINMVARTCWLVICKNNK